MTEELERLIEASKKRRMSVKDRAVQRLSFAYGNGLEDADVVSIESLTSTNKMIRSQLGPKKR